MSNWGAHQADIDAAQRAIDAWETLERKFYDANGIQIGISVWWNGEFLFTHGMWYKFKGRIPDGLTTWWQITHRMQHIWKTGLGHFGNAFKDILDYMNSHASEIGIANIAIDEKNMKFMDFTQMQQVFGVFQDLWVLDPNADYSSQNNFESMNLQTFQENLKWLWENNFFAGNTLDISKLENALMGNQDDSVLNKRQARASSTNVQPVNATS